MVPRSVGPSGGSLWPPTVSQFDHLMNHYRLSSESVGRLILVGQWAPLANQQGPVCGSVLEPSGGSVGPSRGESVGPSGESVGPLGGSVDSGGQW